MPRSYPFEHFRANESQPSRSLRRRDKQHLAGSVNPEAAHGGIHYGKQHAETEELLHARQMTTQLEELAGVGPEKISTAKSAETAESPKYQQTPIGALPLPSSKFSMGMFSELLEDGRRYGEMLVASLRDARTASTHLLKLPLQAGSLVLQRLQPKKA